MMKPSKRITVTEYRRSFIWREDPGSGFGFDCDEHRNIDIEKLQEPAREKLRKCLNGEYDVIDEGVIKHVYSYIEPGEIDCVNCKETVVLHSSWLNTCECGIDYDGSGNKLAPRSQWGEETGETWYDTLLDHDPEEIPYY